MIDFKDYRLYIVLSMLVVFYVNFFEETDETLPVNALEREFSSYDENDSIKEIIDDFIIEKNYLVEHHYRVDEYFDSTCEYRAATSYISVDISYPQVKLLNNELVQKKINVKLKELSMQESIEEATTYKVTYQIEYFQDDLLSVVFKGESFYCYDRHPQNWHSTVNFNLHNAQKYTVDDIFDKTTLLLLRLKVKEYFIQNYPEYVKNFGLDEKELLNSFTLNKESISVYYDSMKATIALSELYIKYKE